MSEAPIRKRLPIITPVEAPSTPEVPATTEAAPTMPIRRPGRRKGMVQQTVAAVEQSAKMKPIKLPAPLFDRVISTGSTLLDLAISGTAHAGGGIPYGIMMEVYGESGSNKTVLLSSIGGFAQRMYQSELRYLDPEGRLQLNFAEMFGIRLEEEDYHRPDTIPEMFDFIQDWKSKKEEDSQVILSDSLAALSTNLEMTTKEGDKMGMRRAKEFSEGFRKTARLFARTNRLLVCSNQIRQTPDGREVAPGGTAIYFYSSLVLKSKRIGSVMQEEVLVHREPVENTVSAKTVSRAKAARAAKEKEDVTEKQQTGVRSVFFVEKSSIDNERRSAVVTMMNGYGIDTHRDELQWFKEKTGAATYDAIGKKFQSLEQAVMHIHEHDLGSQLKERTVNKWMEIQKLFQSKRPARFGKA